MDATSFEFTMRVPGDARLMTPVRELTAHAAAYARLTPAAAAALAAQVTAAAEAAFAASGSPDTAIDFRFRRDAGGLSVRIDLEPARAPRWPISPHAGLTVRTERHGARETCLITQHVP